MIKRRGFAVFIAAFAVVLVSGAAVAQIGTFLGDGNDEIPALAAEGPGSPELARDEPASPPEPAGDDRKAGEADGSDHRADAVAAEEAAVEIPLAESQPIEEPEQPADTDAPDIVVLHPENGAHVSDRTIAFEGRTEPGAVVRAGHYEATVDDEGAWRIVLVLSPGGNLARFTATDAAGNSSEASVKVFYDAETDQAFTAHQKHGESDATPPFDVFWGTATPGAKIWIGSRYGENTTRANDAGKWELEVSFPEAPFGKPFEVVVESSDGGRKVFRFVRIGHEKHEFTAHQKYGESDATPPFDVFWGTATPGAKVWIESPYGHAKTQAGEAGLWDTEVTFPEAPPGKPFEVVVESSDGGRKVFRFVRTGGEDHHEFTAHQAFGECAETLPYDVFWGTATPGATVWVVSDHGAGEARVGDGGGWELRVDFPEAPYDTPFEVVVESSDGGRKVFTFVRLGGAD